MKNGANFLACEHARFCDFWGDFGAGLQPRAGIAAPVRRIRQEKVSCHSFSLIRQLALAVLPRKIFPKSGRLQTYAYLESIYDSLHVKKQRDENGNSNGNFTYLNYTEIDYFLVKREKEKTNACLI